MSKQPLTSAGNTTVSTEAIREVEGEYFSTSLNHSVETKGCRRRLEGASSLMDINAESLFAAKDNDDVRDGLSDMDGSESSTGRSGSFFLQRKIVFAALIFVVGAFASGAFLAIGIMYAKNEQASEFERLADDSVVNLQAAFKDYELFGLWIHESCREKGEAYKNVLGICTRQDFRELYEYIRSVGLDFQSAQFMPYVPHDKREAVEAEARVYYQSRYDHVNYRGIVGLFFDEEGALVLPQDNKEFYWPVHYVEPVMGNEAAIELDIYSSPSQRRNIEYSMQTWMPSVTNRLKLVQETDPNAFSIILHHPGVRLSTHNDTDTPSGVALMVIRIPALLARTNIDATESASFYIYDSTNTYTGDDPVFLGGHSVYVPREGVVLFDGLPEVSLEELESTVDTRLEAREVAIADRTWTIAVVSLPDTYQPDMVFVILGGAIIFMSSLILSTCFWNHMTRVGKMNAIKAQAAREKAEILVDNARQQALVERQLNEYIAHEVRNPLSSAMAALSFVSSAAKQPEQSAQDRQVMRDDLKIIDASLQLINELLRNMLDIHRAANQHMKITLAPTDLFKDVLEPVASILHMRGNKVEIITECAPNIVAMSDRLRLKQIVLNLAVNSTKFVEKGFIKLKCIVEDGHNGPSVQIHLEDSGPGIPLEKRSNLFAKYQESLDVLNQGTGIGLCLCKHLTNLMEGDIWLDEKYDSGIEGCPGTRFVLDLNVPPLSEDYWDENHSLIHGDTLRQGETHHVMVHPSGPCVSVANPSLDAQPCTTEARLMQPQSLAGSTVAKQQPPSTIESPHSHVIHPSRQELPGSLRVLFCDDDMILRKLFVRSLKRVAPDWDVQEVANGETAIRIVESSAFDVIFLDQYMSSTKKQLLGTETARVLRARGVTSRICGLSANDAEEAFLEAGADCFLFKPFPCEQEALKRAMAQVLFAPSRSSRTATAPEELGSEWQNNNAGDNVLSPPNVESIV